MLEELSLRDIRYSLELADEKCAIAKRLFGEKMAASPKSVNPLSSGEIGALFVVVTLIHPIVMIIVNFSMWRWSDTVYDWIAWFGTGERGDGKGLLAVYGAIIWVAISGFGATIAGQYGEDWVAKQLNTDAKLKPVDAYKKEVRDLERSLEKRYEEEEEVYRKHLAALEQKRDAERRAARMAMTEAWSDWCISKGRYKDAFDDPTREFKIAWAKLNQKDNPIMRVVNSLPSLQGAA